MRFTIRFSILSFFIALLLITGFSIVVTNNYILDRVLIRSSRQMLSHSSDLIRSRLITYLQPLHDSVALTKKLFISGVITPEESKEYRRYLIDLIKDNPSILSAYFGTPQGDHNTMEKIYKKDRFENIVIYRTRMPSYELRHELNIEGAILETHKTTDLKFDPRSRPWYKEAVSAKKQTWSNIYQFSQFLTDKQKVSLGISAVAPVYDPSGELKGVFGMDTTLGDVADFMSTLKATDNMVMFVIDPNGNYMASKNTYDLMSDQSIRSSLQNISNLSIPWAKFSFELHKKNQLPIFIYNFNGEKYIAAYRTIDPMMGKSWYIGVVLPVWDITAPLKKNLLASLEIALIVLLLGVFSARFIASGISKPIAQLSNEARLMADLRFEESHRVESYLSEVHEIQSAFDAMRNGVHSFSRYVPFALVKSLVKSGQVAHVGGENKEVSVLFSDIRGFTSLSENIPPKQLMGYLSEYFEEMTSVILKNHGRVDKYIGDAVMAFWGAPLEDDEHVFHACQAALALYDALDEFNRRNRAKGQPEWGMRLAVNTGEVVVGNVGSNDRLSYTAIGDNVNLASRLEGLNKEYGTNIMVSEAVYEKVKDRFQFRLLDRVAVRGKKHGGYVFELLRPGNAFGEKLSSYNTFFREAFMVYEKGEWKQAVRLFERMKEEYPDDGLLTLYIERCTLLQKEKPMHWDGVWVVDKKVVKSS